MCVHFFFKLTVLQLEMVFGVLFCCEIFAVEDPWYSLMSESSQGCQIQNCKIDIMIFMKSVKELGRPQRNKMFLCILITNIAV